MSPSLTGVRRALTYTSLAVALCVITLSVIACGGGDASAETTDAGGMIAEPLTSLPDGAADSPGVDAELVGKWHSDQTGETFEFTADGALIVTSGGGGVTEMSYAADGSNVFYILEGVVVYTGTYSVDGDVLSQVDPDITGTVRFDRVM